MSDFISNLHPSAEINDIRVINDFKGITFSNYKHLDVKNELIQSLLNSKIEPACYWGAEMVCSGHFSELWETILFFYSKYVHIGNPKMAIYIEMRLNIFKSILNSGYSENELLLRNNSKIRHIFAEILTILCLGKRKHTFHSIVMKTSDFEMSTMSEKMRATNVEFIKDIFLEDDAKELFIAANELAFCITKNICDVVLACHWLEWMIEYERKCKQKKEKCECQRRSNMNVDSKYQKETIWLIWNILLKESLKRNAFIQKVVDSLLTLFCIRYTSSTTKKRKYILYFVISLICENIQFTKSEEIIKESQKHIVTNVLQKVDVIYKQIKKNEKAPRTDYLFMHHQKDDKNNNLQKSLNKMNQLNEIDLQQRHSESNNNNNIVEQITNSLEEKK